MNQTSSTKSATDPETNTLVVSKANLAPPSSRRAAAKHISNETPEILPNASSISHGTHSSTIKSSVKLPVIPSNNKLSRSLISETNEASVSRSNINTRATNYTRKSKHKLPLITPRNVRKRVSFSEQDTFFPIDNEATDNESEQVLDSSESTTGIFATSENPEVRLKFRFIHDFRLIWLNSNITKLNVEFENSINQLRHIIDIIDSYKDPEACKDFLRKKTDETIFLIIPYDLSQSIIPEIHDTSQLHSIFIFCKNIPTQKQWIKKWTKIKGFFTSIDSIYEVLTRETERYYRDSITFSISSIDSDRLDPSFKYTLLLKEILLEMEYDDTAKKHFTEFCREYYADDPYVLKDIEKFEKHYNMYTPTWWYTGYPFIYERVNEALRLQKTSIIIKMGFFIRDLYNQIEQLYKPLMEKKTFYRGQGLSYAHFNQLRTRKGGLFSFNNFLSTSTDRKVAFSRADSCRFAENPEQIGILFQITVDPTIVTTPSFASLDKVSFYNNKEEETLFFTHTVFRIDEIKSLENRLWQVDLSLTNDNDDELRNLIEHIRNETQETTGWARLGTLLLKMEKFEKAEEVFKILIENSNKNDEGLPYFRYSIGLIKKSEGNYKEALISYKEALMLYQTSSSSHHLELARIYNDMGSIYKETEEYIEALECFQKAVNYLEEHNPLSDLNLAATYNNMADVYKILKQYSKALDLLEKLSIIHKKSGFYDYTHLSSTFTNIAEVYFDMEEYSEALQLFRKASNIQQRCLAPNIINTATMYNRIGQVYEKMGKDLDASTYYERSIKYCQTELNSLFKQSPLNMSNRAMLFNNIAHVCTNMKNYLKALEYYQKTLGILKRSPELKQPNLATTIDNIGQMYENIGKYYEATLSYRQAIRIARESLTQNRHLQLYQKHLTELEKKYKL